MSNESLFREVDEEVRQEQFKKLWERYGNAVIVLVFVVVVLVAGYRGWQYWQLKQAEGAGQNYFNALKTAASGKTDEGIQQLTAITHSGFKELASFRSAALLAQQGKTDEAVKAYAAISADTSADQSLRELADIRAGYLLVDTTSPQDLQTRLARYDVEGSLWRNEVREIVGLAAWRSMDYALAETNMNSIMTDPQAPPGLRQRAKTMLDLLAPLLPQK